MNTDTVDCGGHGFKGLTGQLLKGKYRVGKYLMFFHSEPPGVFKKLANIGIAWSDDLLTWNWPGKK